MILPNKALCACFHIAAIFAAGCNSAPRVTANVELLRGLHSLAVVSFSDAPGAEGGYSGDTVAAAVAQGLMTMPNIRVVERERLRSVVMEQDLQATNLVDPKTAVRVGRLVGADGVVTGAVSQYDTDSVPVFLGLFTYYADVYKVGVTMRLIRVDTGELCFTGEHSLTSAASYQDAVSKCVGQILAELSLRMAAGESESP